MSASQISDCVGLPKLTYEAGRQMEPIASLPFIDSFYKLYRMATIDDNNDFFHAILTLISDRYLAASNEDKKGMSQDLRKSIAYSLTQNCKTDYGDQSCWIKSPISGILERQLTDMSDEFYRDRNTTLSSYLEIHPNELEFPEKAISFFNSNQKMDPRMPVEYFHAVADIIGFKIMILDMCEQGTEIYIASDQIAVDKDPVLFLGLTQDHYEAIWVRNEGTGNFSNIHKINKISSWEIYKFKSVREDPLTALGYYTGINGILSDWLYTYVNDLIQINKENPPLDYDSSIAKFMIELYTVAIAMSVRDPVFRLFFRPYLSRQGSSLSILMRGLSYDPKHIVELLLRTYDDIMGQYGF